MNPELIEKLQQYNLKETSSKNIIKAVLNIGISAKLYEEIEGEEISDKVETIHNYLHNVIKEPEAKQTLNIVIADDASSLEYVSYLNEKYEVIVHQIDDVKDPKDIDLVLFTGGEDVNPVYYNENIGKYTSINSNRDKKEYNTFQKFKGQVLFLGICRGSQMMTVLSGGRLIQHVEGHGRDHSMILNNRLSYKITSSHHQMLYPFDMNPKDYELLAYSEYFQSKTYLNGNNEEIELSKDFLEPEIVYYKNTNALCIQGHPEWSHCERRTASMCLNLIDKYLKEFKNDKATINPNYYKTIDMVAPVSYDDEDDDEEDYHWEIVEKEPEQI